MNKGNIVLVTKSVYTKDQVAKQLVTGQVEILRRAKTTKVDEAPRHLYRMRHFKPFEALVVGWSIRISGIYTPGRTNFSFEGGDEYDPGELYDTKHHTVIMVQPLDTERWTPPVPCLEEDLELIEFRSNK